MSGPAVLKLRGERVRLRGARAEEVDALWAGLSRSRWTPVDRARLESAPERWGRLAEGRLRLAIESDGRLIGDCDARSVELPPGVWELGIYLWDERDRRRGYATEAFELLVAYCLEELGAARLQAATAVANAPMRRVLEKLGFAQEGVLRSFFPRADDRDDYVLYARLG